MTPARRIFGRSVLVAAATVATFAQIATAATLSSDRTRTTTSVDSMVGDPYKGMVGDPVPWSPTGR